jgi:hypothetical protein
MRSVSVITEPKMKTKKSADHEGGGLPLPLIDNWQASVDISQTTAPAIASPEAEQLGTPEIQIFEFFAQRLKTGSLDDFLALFQCFFIDHDETQLPDRLRELGAQMMLQNQHVGFIRLLKRCCYLFIEACFQRQDTHQIIQITQLLALPVEESTLGGSITQERFRDWLRGFVNSSECHVLRALAPPSSTNPHSWGDRYLAFTLFAQSLDTDVSPEQRRASGMLYQLYRTRYRFQLAIYLSTKGHMTAQGVASKNPTLIDDVTLSLIHRLVIRKRPSYPDLAAQFLAQMSGKNLASWQPVFLEYLFSGMTSPRRLRWLPEKFEQYLRQRYPHSEAIALDQVVVNYVCQGIIDYLLNPNHLQDLSHPLPVLMIQREYLTLSILLLKLVLLAPENHARLLLRLSVLLDEYRHYPKAECQWLRGFFETIQVILVLVLPSPQVYPMVTTTES